ncbi:N-acetylmuramoyl-L-alanine amidase family protein [Coraliomargarita parva]|uniref:N-acetylmuramoyl-L-alanine amidase family protein n=1 Tax=Coraliomargarita parva TaxID=3014050 RepID=UPI0022B52537|nr:N-acetylmuramoyl-L-alanine amidase [Coraliomargarita parva]
MSVGHPLCLIPLALVLAFGSLSARSLERNGKRYIDLATIAHSLGMQSYWLKDARTYRLHSQWTTIDADNKLSILKINGLPVHLGAVPVQSGKALFLAETDYRNSLQPVLTPQVFGSAPGLKRIVIDAGHGGRDEGAHNSAYGLKEKYLTLDVAVRLKRLLELSGYEVVLTRSSDKFVELPRRSAYANFKDADLFISIHFNSAGNPDAAGFETYAMTPQFQTSTNVSGTSSEDSKRWAGNGQDPWNSLLAYHVQRSLVTSLGGPDRGFKRARFAVLKDLQCPGVLVELGFLSNAATAQQMRTTEYRETLARSLSKGIVAYGQRLERLP